jgi:hypothetical protein
MDCLCGGHSQQQIILFCSSFSADPASIVVDDCTFQDTTHSMQQLRIQHGRFVYSVYPRSTGPLGATSTGARREMCSRTTLCGEIPCVATFFATSRGPKVGSVGVVSAPRNWRLVSQSSIDVARRAIGVGDPTINQPSTRRLLLNIVCWLCKACAQHERHV